MSLIFVMSRCKETDFDEAEIFRKLSLCDCNSETTAVGGSFHN